MNRARRGIVFAAVALLSTSAFAQAPAPQDLLAGNTQVMQTEGARGDLPGSFAGAAQRPHGTRVVKFSGAKID